MPPGSGLSGPHAGVFFFCSMPERSVLFVDGNNWYHSLTKLGISNLGRFNFAKVSRKLIGPREWTATRY